MSSSVAAEPSDYELAGRKQSNRQSEACASLRRMCFKFNKAHPKANVVVVVQSGYSNDFPLSMVFGSIANDGVWANKLRRSIEQNVRQHAHRPDAPPVLDLSTAVCCAPMEETLAASVVLGFISRKQVDDILLVGKQLRKGELSRHCCETHAAD